MIKKIVQNPFVWAFVIGCGLLTVYPFMAKRHMHAAPPLFAVGDWQLVGDNGQPFGSHDVKGKVVIASFIFTTCPTLCPMVTQHMKEVHSKFDRYADKVHFISVTVDPEVDTPQVLTTYKYNYGIRAANWTFLTGPKKDIYHLAEEQLKLHVGEKRQLQDGSEAYDIDHVAQLLLIDQTGNLRGLFPTDPVGLATLERSAKYLVEHGG